MGANGAPISDELFCALGFRGLARLHLSARKHANLNSRGLFVEDKRMPTSTPVGTADAAPVTVFRFVSARAPRPLEADQSLSFITLAEELATPLVTVMQAARAVEAVAPTAPPHADPGAETSVATSPPEDSRVTALRALANQFTTGDNWLGKPKHGFRSEVEPLLTLGRWLRARQETLTAADLSAMPPPPGEWPLNSTALGALWDNVIASAIPGVDPRAGADAQLALRAWNFLSHYQDAAITTDADLRRLVRAKVLLPNTIFPLPTPPVVAQSVTESAARTAARETATALSQQLTAYQQAARELRKLLAKRVRAARAALPITLLTSASEEPSSATPAVSPEVLGTTPAVSAATATVLAALEATATSRISDLVAELEEHITELTTEAFRSARAYQPIARIGNTLWTSPASGDAADSSEAPAPAALQKNTNQTDDAYIGFYTGTDARARIRPLGIIDFMRVEQTLHSYEPGEVAHIENILPGELKDRTTRRLRRAEESRTSITERESTQERDTATSERNELSREASHVAASDTAFNINASVSGSYGPVTASVSAGYATSSHSEDANTQASAYAKSVTDRSLQRIVERVHEERTTKLIEEYEETNQHTLNNVGNSKAVVGIYRWVDKVFDVKLVNYGKRLVFEFFITEPAATYLWRMAGADHPTSALRKPIDPRLADVLLAPGLQGGGFSRLDNPTNITKENYAQWGALYGVQLEVPPVESIYIATSFEIHGEPTYPIPRAAAYGAEWYLAGVNRDLEVPTGYQARVVRCLVANLDPKLSRHNNSELYVYVAENQTLFWSDDTVGFGGPNEHGNRGQLQRDLWINPVTGVVPISYMMRNAAYAVINVQLECIRTEETMIAWQAKAYQAIIAAYEQQRAAYESAVAQVTSSADDAAVHGQNPLLNRATEQQELKLACISWLFGEGNDFSSWSVWRYGDPDNPPHQTMDAGAVAAGQTAQFVEQCFDWELMAYWFFPYFWTNKNPLAPALAVHRS